MSVSSDPNRWLLGVYAALRSHHAFGTFAPSIQFEQLAQAVEREHPSKVATMRQWSAAQHMLWHLASMHEQKERAAPVELWRVRKSDRTLACIAVYLTHGVDVRLMEASDFRRKQLCRDARGWKRKSRTALIDVGWISNRHSEISPRRVRRTKLITPEINFMDNFALRTLPDDDARRRGWPRRS